jgi:galactonate dehydratase
MDATISRITPAIVTVSDKTKWFFIEMESSDGVCGIGEATRFGHEDALWEAAEELAETLHGRKEGEIDALVRYDAMTNPIARAAISAVEQARWDIRGKRENLPVHQLFGAPERDRIPIYANINRRTDDRTPVGFKVSALDAIGAGYRVIKIAPFDDLTPENDDDALYDAGLARTKAVCNEVGPDIGVMVDCHWRLTPGRAERFIEAAGELGLVWVECPLPEEPRHMEDLKHLRGCAAKAGTLLAGAERGIGIEYFNEYLDAGIYDVIMPDVKYTGGMRETRRIAAAAGKANVAVSPHNPSGPVAHMASLHLSAGLRNFMNLEHQFDETPLFHSLCPDAVPPVIDGFAALPTAPGLGITLDLSTLG